MDKILLVAWNKQQHHYNYGYNVYINGDVFGYIGYNEKTNVKQWYAVYFPDYLDRSCHRVETIAEAKRELLKQYKENGGIPKNKKKQPKSDIKYLPLGDNSDFFPTPSALCGKMMARIKWSGVRTVLEPSAGKGDICDAIKGYFKENHKYQLFPDIDCIERDENLRYILKGKGYRVVHDDFLTYKSRKHYDLIIMNPPFSEGDAHLIKALEMCATYGGEVVCLLNAETLRKDYSNTRKYLKTLLSKYGAEVEYLKNCFKKAERKTDVEIAFIYVHIPCEEKESEFFTKMKKAQEYEEKAQNVSDVAKTDQIETLVRSYEVECAASIEFLKEYERLRPRILNSFDEKYSYPTISLKIGDRAYSDIGAEAINKYLQLVRGKYWRKLLSIPELREKMTAKINERFNGKIEEMSDYDFTEFNIQEVIFEIQNQLYEGIEDEIVQLFVKLSSEHSYYDECKQNIHYYNGWKTNKAHKVNYKVIIPAHGAFATHYREKHGRYVDCYDDHITSYKCVQILSDIEKTLDYLGGKGLDITRCTLTNSLDVAEKTGQTKDIECQYFSVTFYKKGTCHITFNKDSRILIDRLNLYVGKDKGWLPPDYGKKAYASMEEDEKAVADSFSGGEKGYNEIYKNQEKYLIEKTDILMIGG